MATIKELIKQLEMYDQNESVIYQFIVAGHTNPELSKEEFATIADTAEYSMLGDSLSETIFEFVRNNNETE